MQVNRDPTLRLPSRIRRNWPSLSLWQRLTIMLKTTWWALTNKQSQFGGQASGRVWEGRTIGFAGSPGLLKNSSEASAAAC